MFNFKIIVLLTVVILSGCSKKLSDTVQQVRSSVVHIEKLGQWQGSGFVLTQDGIIVTAKHVVEGGGEFIVTFDDGTQYKTSTCLQNNNYDVGFLKLNKFDCVPLPLGSITKLRAGDPIFVMGSPLGKEQFNSVTAGIVSAVQRDWDQDSRGLGWKILFQGDTPGVYPGNSGGPVFNLQGEVVGVLVAGVGPGLNCSVPVDVFLDKILLIRLGLEQQSFSVPTTGTVGSYEPKEEMNVLPMDTNKSNYES
jgi:serine protease Do